MATKYASVDLVDIDDLASPIAFGFPSATDQSQGYADVYGELGDNVVITVYGDGSTNSGYTPHIQNYTGGTVSSVSAIGTQSPYPYTTVYVNNMSQAGYVDILCPPGKYISVTSTYVSRGWRASLYIHLLDLTVSLQYSTINMYTSHTSYTQQVSGAGATTIYYAMTTPYIPNGTDINDYFTSTASNYIARTFDTNATRPFSTTGTGTAITRDLPSSSDTSKTVYIYGANLSGERSQYTGTTYTVNLVALPPTVSASKAIITNGFGMYSNPTGTTSGTIEYKWTTTGGGSGSNQNVNASYGWNSSGNLSQNAGVGTEWVGTTWSVQARATVNGGASYVYGNSSSVTLPEYTVTAPTSIEEGQSDDFEVNSTNTLGPVYWQVTPTSEFSTSSGQSGGVTTSQSGGIFTVSPTSDGVTEGTETATVKLYINNTFNNTNYLYATDTFDITEAPPVITAPTVNSGTWTQDDANGNESEHAGVTIAWSGGQNGTLQLAVSKTNSAPTSGWVTDIDQVTPGLLYYDSDGDQLDRGTTYYLWARRSTTAVSSSISSTAPYLPISDSSISIGVPTDKDGNALSANNSGVYVIPNTYGSSSGDTILIPYSGGGSVDQYRIVSDDAPTPWLDTKNGASGTFVLDPVVSTSGGSYTEIPGAGQTWEYEFEGRRATTYGGHPSTADAYWTSVDGTQIRRLYRQPASTYTVTAPNSINEGQTLTFTITTSNVPNNTTVAWTLGGTLQSGDYTANNTSPATITNNSATISFSITNDNVADGNKTATLTLAANDSDGRATGTPSKSVTVVDTSNPGTGGGSSGTGSTGNFSYGLEVNNFNGSSVIVDENSRITNFLASGTFNSASSSSTVLFSNFDCSDISETGFIVTWTGALYSSPTITRRSSSLGGITVTKNSNDTTSSTAGIATIELVRF